MSRSLSEMSLTWTLGDKIELTRSVIEPVLMGLSFKPVDAFAKRSRRVAASLRVL